MSDSTIDATLSIEVFVTCPNDDCGFYIDLLRQEDTNNVHLDDDGYVTRQIFSPSGEYDDFECEEVTCSQCKTQFNVNGLSY